MLQYRHGLSLTFTYCSHPHWYPKITFDMSNVKIPLESNSLYICTIPLTGLAFHWALIHIDSAGIHTRHHWAATTPNILGREDYVENSLPHGAFSQTGNNKILGYFKIVDCALLDIATFRDVCKQVFPTSYPTVAENRRQAITCRTWIIHIITKIMSEARALEIEERVKALSTTQSNEYASSFLMQRPFRCIVRDV